MYFSLISIVNSNDDELRLEFRFSAMFRLHTVTCSMFVPQETIKNAKDSLTVNSSFAEFKGANFIAAKSRKFPAIFPKCDNYINGPLMVRLVLYTAGIFKITHPSTCSEKNLLTIVIYSLVLNLLM